MWSYFFLLIFYWFIDLVYLVFFLGLGFEVRYPRGLFGIGSRGRGIGFGIEFVFVFVTHIGAPTRDSRPYSQFVSRISNSKSRPYFALRTSCRKPYLGLGSRGQIRSWYDKRCVIRHRIQYLFFTNFGLAVFLSDIVWCNSLCLLWKIWYKLCLRYATAPTLNFDFSRSKFKIQDSKLELSNSRTNKN